MMMRFLRWLVFQFSGFRMARDRMAWGLRKDEGLQLTYVANIAMLLYDNVERCDPTTVVGCNKLAKQIIKLVWDVKVSDEVSIFAGSRPLLSQLAED